MPTVKEGYSLTQIYAFYKEKCVKNNEKVLDKKLHRDVCKEFNKMVIQGALEGKIMKLPFFLGSIWVKKFKVDWSRPAVDFNATRKAGHTVYFTNEHSDNYNARWAWVKLNKITPNMRLYTFTAAKPNVRALARILFSPDGHKRFYK
jgi:hypothetical protein